MKKIVIAHRWNGNPDSDWYSWLKRELMLIGFDVVAPEIPNPDNPQIGVWLQTLYDNVHNPSETFFVGHGIGAQAIMRYLDTLDGATKIGGAIFVAPWFTLKGLVTERELVTVAPWLTEPIDSNKIKNMGEFFAFFTQNDPHVDLENKKLFEDRLGARTFVFEAGGHLTEEDGVKEIPEVLLKLRDIIAKK